LTREESVMATITFDVPEEQAEGHAKALTVVMRQAGTHSLSPPPFVNPFR
jgi:hypothetical protein